MLINLKINNFKSYSTESEFSMYAEKIEDLKYSTFEYIKNNKTKKALCSSVIYGPNASGKSNIIDALAVLKNIIMSGNIRNKTDLALEFLPNINSNKDEPTTFEIEFYFKEILYKYYLSINIGKFLTKSYTRFINKEILYINDKVFYERNKQQLSLFLNTSTKKYLNKAVDENTSHLLENSLVNTELFLVNGFKTISKQLSQDIISWFERKLEIRDKLNDISMLPVFDKDICIDKFSDKIAKESGITGSSIAYLREEDGDVRLKSIIGNNIIDAEFFESYGTQRIVKLMPAILMSLTEGSVLVIDELDVALHPTVVMNIINLFHNDEINTNHAQLIFNTHNPIYLNNAIFRRDEIKFVEKDTESNSSTIYKLSDFGTKGKHSVRNVTNYIKNYFTNRYGAIMNIDYSDIFKEVLEKKRDEDDKKEN